MARKLGEILQELPKERRELIETHADAFLAEVSNLEKLRKLRGLVQKDIANHLNIQQASVSKMERQTDMYLSTLRNFVEACGGELELTVKFPEHKTPLRLTALSDT
ncbi:XRE family transcriptional regulator [Thalassospira lucentensis]|uniref:Transcriptional regulator n=1 Tax=Thalassospira lucentensis TaxID=168935 RepID=A0A358HVE2_9PROT|nr:XRE family transcriptional regulator [Thalassospira lucentensis]HBU99147.1 transcriptional regulator [Thalassospira lucentensis]HCW65633.1 transcriptional regulator [Thalassospira lucentensis]|tara:strand:+ start:822 stop:1139 length:318 start_codon:yes stop_codon:yes gene_type:complete